MGEGGDWPHLALLLGNTPWSSDKSFPAFPKREGQGVWCYLSSPDIWILLQEVVTSGPLFSDFSEFYYLETRVSFYFRS